MKKMWKLVIILTLVILILLSGHLNAERVAVMNFETDGIPWTDDADFEKEVLQSITREFTGMLHDKGSFDVVDYSRVRDVLSQAGYEYGKGMPPTMIPHISRALENNLLILGTVNKLKLSEAGKISVGPVTLSGLNAEVELSARLIDSNTGNTLVRYSGSGDVTEGGLEIDEIEGISIGSEAFADSAVGKAITEALEKMTGRVVEEENIIFKEYVEFGDDAVDEELVIEGEIVDTIGNSLVLNIGIEDGLEEGFKGKIIRYIDTGSDDPMSVSYGEVEISSVDDRTSIASVIESEEEPEINDIVEVSSGSTDRTSSQTAGSVIETLETEDFIIYIESAIRSRDEVTISGTVEAKNEAELTISIPSGLEFYDHTGGTVTIKRSGIKVQIGNSVSSGSSTLYHSNTARVKENILPGYPQMISWTFNQVPEDADHLARLRLPIETESVGEIDINLDGIDLISY